MSEVYLSQESKNAPVVIMQINCADGGVCSLYIGEHDDATQLADLFITQLALPAALKDRVEGQINERRKQFFETRLREQTEEQAVYRDEPDIAETANASPAEAAYSKARFDWNQNNHNQNSPFAKLLRKMSLETPGHSPGGKPHKNDRKAFYSASKSSVSNQKPLPNQAAFDRMFDYSKGKEQRQEQRRNEQELERMRSIESTTFK
jgi:hypothetical protein